MNSGFCECAIGQDGSPCKHQALLWSNGCISNINFMPIFHKEIRQKFSYIAVGNSLSLEFYEGLHEDLIEAPTSAVDVAYSNSIALECNKIQPGCDEARPPTNDPSHMSISNEETHQLLQKSWSNNGLENKKLQ